VVLTSDHGEGLGQHGEQTHGVFAYEPTLRVPLILFAPRLFGPVVVRSPARHVDVLPTVLDLLGIPTPPDLPGRSLRIALEKTEDASPPAYFEALSSSLNRGWAPLYGVVHDGWKYIDLPIPELYHLTDDPGETRNLAAVRPDELARMRGLLRGLRAADRGIARGTEAVETIDRLRSLGYAAGGATRPRDRYDEADDPKRLMELEELSTRMLSRYWAGDLDGALALGLEGVRRRPEDPLAYLQLAYLQRARGDLPAAIAAARKAVALRPDNAESVSILGVYLNETGRAAEVLRLLEPYVTGPEPDLDVLTAYGMALAALGRRSDALRAFERARAVDPSSAMVRVNIGTVYLMDDDLDQAGRSFQAALEIDPGVARAHNSLGVIAAREGRTEEAIAHWKRAVALDARDYQTLFNLGSVLHRQGRTQEARGYLEAYLRVAPPSLEARDIARVRAWLGQPPPGARSGR
jgi:tetratricopeptide (TPR) repeat protein